MGTRADFYVGRGAEAEWLGSVAYDGHPCNFDSLIEAETIADHDLRGIDFRRRVDELLGSRPDATLPSEGWPWPWSDSVLTDYSYAFDDGHVWVTDLRYDADDLSYKVWIRGTILQQARAAQRLLDASSSERAIFPDMSAIQKVKFGGPGSGVIILKVGE